MPKVIDQTELTAAPAATDMFLVSEISSGLSKKINFNRMISGYRNFTTGAWTFPTPSAGAPLTLGAAGSGIYSLSLASGINLTVGGAVLDFSATGATVAQINYYGSTFMELVSRNAAAGLKLYVANGVLSTTWAATGAVSIAAPTSGKPLAVDGEVNVASGTATPAGGTAGKGLTMGTTVNLGVFFGSGAPTLSAAQGSLYIRTDGSSTSTRMYVNTTGSTVWTNVTTAT